MYYIYIETETESSDDDYEIKKRNERKQKGKKDAKASQDNIARNPGFTYPQMISGLNPSIQYAGGYCYSNPIVNNTIYNPFAFPYQMNHSMLNSKVGTGMPMYYSYPNFNTPIQGLPNRKFNEKTNSQITSKYENGRTFSNAQIQQNGLY